MRSRVSNQSIEIVCVLVAAAFPVAAQSTAVVTQVVGAVNDLLGQHGGAIGLGDVDGDGISDFAAAAVGIQGQLPYLRAYSGSTGSVLWSHQVRIINLEGGGDVNADGLDDVVAWVAPAGSIEVRSGADGSLIRQHNPLIPGFELGDPGVVFGDIDGDGRDEYLLQESLPFTPWFRGFGFVYSGRTGLPLYVVPGFVSKGRNWSTRLGDINDDGLPDFAVAEQNCQPGVCDGSIAAYSGRTAALVYRIAGAPAEGLGFGAPGVGGVDVNLDGIPDFLSSTLGTVSLRSGADGSTLWTRFSTTTVTIGGQPAIGDDWSGDGYPDVVIGTSPPSAWSILSGVDGSTLSSFLQALSPLPGGPQLGAYPRRFDDVDGDGSREMLSTGDVLQLFTGPRGAVFVTKHASPGIYSYQKERRFGCPASNGSMPRISMAADPGLGTIARVRLLGTVPGSPAALAIGSRLANTGMPWVAGCNQYVNLAMVLAGPPTDAAGSTAIDIPVPSNSVLAGLPLSMQWFVLDPPANPSALIGSSRLDILLGH